MRTYLRFPDIRQSKNHIGELNAMVARCLQSVYIGCQQDSGGTMARCLETLTNSTIYAHHRVVRKNQEENVFTIAFPNQDIRIRHALRDEIALLCVAIRTFEPSCADRSNANPFVVALHAPAFAREMRGTFSSGCRQVTNFHSKSNSLSLPSIYSSGIFDRSR